MNTTTSPTALNDEQAHPRNAMLRSRALAWLKRVALGLGIGLVMLVAIGAAYQDTITLKLKL